MKNPAWIKRPIQIRRRGRDENASCRTKAEADRPIFTLHFAIRREFIALPDAWLA